MYKKMIEKRNEKVAEMEAINGKAIAETRAFTEEENAQLEALEAEVRAMDATIERLQNSLEAIEVGEGGGENRAEDTEAAEVRAFASYIRGRSNELRAATNLEAGTEGAVIPKTIAAKIVKQIYDVSPILQNAQRYNVKGELVVPVYDEKTSSTAVAYATEFEDLVSGAGKFTKVSLKGFLAGALCKVSRSMLNNSDLALVSFVVADIAEKAARWIEGELLNGTTGKIAGLSGVTQVVTTAYKDEITIDELIDTQDAVPDALQNGAIWIMNSATRSMIRKLEDKMGRKYLLDDVTAPWGKVLLGKPVYVSDNMAAPASGKKVVYYGNMKGLAVKFAEEPAVEVLREKFALQHALGAVCWMEFDAAVVDKQAISCLKMGTAAKPGASE
ncbi:phage major capsid protein [Parvibacter caecicola]|uniref:phage major capsid protein n=1 Tax=Parvibacter caecicola TaxID=747645 RepID=UPI00249A745B|nr:phage major capsid protein [Parvibacter caecicola]